MNLGDERILSCNTEEGIICNPDTVDEGKQLQPPSCFGSNFHKDIIGDSDIKRAIDDDFEPWEEVGGDGMSE